MKVLIVVPPFASLDFPSIEASVLKSSILQEGHEGRVLYLNRDFATFLGTEAYSEIAEIPPTYGAAEWVGIGRVSESKYQATNIQSRRFEYFINYLKGECCIDEETATRLTYAKVRINEFIVNSEINDACEDADLILVCCRHQQLGFAAMLGSRLEDLEVRAASYLFGQQVNTEEQARELTRVFPHYSGVIYQMNPKLIAEHLSELTKVESVAGVYNRSWDNSTLEPMRQTRNLETVPDFSDFFSNSSSDSYSVLPFQMSHGCWWAEKSHCNFCGLIQAREQYLSLGKVESQNNLQKLIGDHEILHIVFADHLFDTRQPDEALEIPILTEFDTSFFCELKASTPRKKIEKLVSLGMITAEFGIESLDANTLRTIGKGANVFQNICALKWSVELGFSAFWSWIIGFEGETRESLDAQLSLAKKLFHLPPPLHATRVRLERRSPLFDAPGKNGMECIRPQEAFLHTFPLPTDSLMLISNYFEYRSINDEDMFNDKLQSIKRLVVEWRRAWRPNLLYYLKGPGFVKIYDRRNGTSPFQGEVKEIVLRDWRAAVFKKLEFPVRIEAIKDHLSKQGEETTKDQLLELLTELLKLELVFRVADRWMSIVPRGNIQRLAWERMQDGQPESL